MGKGGRRESKGDVTTERSGRCNTAGFEDGGRGARTKEYGQPLEAGKGEGMASSLEPPKRNAALRTP